MASRTHTRTKNTVEVSGICPTCGRSGPDTAVFIFDAGMYEASCGDEWHTEIVAVGEGGDS